MAHIGVIKKEMEKGELYHTQDFLEIIEPLLAQINNVLHNNINIVGDNKTFNEEISELVIMMRQRLNRFQHSEDEKKNIEQLGENLGIDTTQRSPLVIKQATIKYFDRINKDAINTDKKVKSQTVEHVDESQKEKSDNKIVSNEVESYGYDNPEKFKSRAEEIKKTVEYIQEHLDKFIADLAEISFVSEASTDDEQYVIDNINSTHNLVVKKIISKFSEKIELTGIMDSLDTYLQKNKDLNNFDGDKNRYINYYNLGPIKKKFHQTLKTTLFEGYRSFSVMERHFDELPEFSKFKNSHIFTDYEKFQSQVLDKMEEFLNQVNILPNKTQRGEQFNLSLHIPYDVAESDSQLPNNTVKKVVNEGFQQRKNGNTYILEPTEVILVGNE